MSWKDLFDALLAKGPALSLGNHTNALDSLIGSWNVEVLDAEDDGAKRVNAGEWHFAWVLDGTALQDVLIVPRRSERQTRIPPKGNRYVTTIRAFDLVAGAWRAFFVDPINREYLSLIARKEDGGMVQEGVDLSGSLHRKTLFDVTRDSFRARDEVSADHGATWQTRAEFHAERTA